MINIHIGFVAGGGEVLVGDELVSVNGTALGLLSGSEVRQLLAFTSSTSAVMVLQIAEVPDLDSIFQ